ncbi:MAG: GNAT family N-acetyltransferase [Alphaproteobacteria bacterium]|nr:GNAT family N-acetyltransferase [Alphaproteobacteria bacterium]MDE2336563.1 GNAT family N-acetyltransferase [Alphaproteobacteria bacterium]
MTGIRIATADDIAGLLRVAEDMEAVNEPGYFERCLAEQAEKKRTVHVAEAGGRLVGYAQLVWVPAYSTFRRLDIPEIQDLNVIPDMRGQGIGGRLIDVCETAARAAGKTEMGISVGLTQSFGPAQRLYVKKGYVPDGTGMCYDDVPVRTESLRTTLWHNAVTLDNLLTIKMVKVL